MRAYARWHTLAVTWALRACCYVPSFGERRTEIMEGEYRPASCICNISFPTCGVAKHSCYFLELCQGEVRHSRGPDGPGPPARGLPISSGIVSCVHAHQRPGRRRA